MGTPNLIPIPNPDDKRGIVRALAKLASLRLNADSTPTFAELTLTELTKSRLVATDSDKTLVSSDLINWVAGTADEIEITDDGDGTITIGIVDPLIVSKGGTGTASLTDHSLLVGSGTDAITALGEATDGQLPIGSTGNDPVLATLTGTSNQINISNGPGSITLSTPQDIHTGASPTFVDITLTAFDSSETIGHVLTDTINPGILDTITVSDDGGRDISWTAGEIYTPDGDIISTVSGSSTCTDNAVNYLVWSSGTSLTLQTSPPSDGEIGIAEIAVAAGDIWEIDEVPILNRLLYDIQRELVRTFPIIVETGLVVSEDTDATNAFDVVSSAGAYHRDINNRHVVPQIYSRTTPMRRWYHSGGVWTNDTNAEIDNTQYDNGTNLVSLSPGKWTKSLFLVSEDEIHWIYPQEEFNNLNAALVGDLPTLPGGLEAFPRTTALIMKEGETSFPPAGSDRWIDVRPLFSPAEIVSSLITQHSSLGGLTEDDHPQYLLVDGTRAMSGDLDLGGNDLLNPGVGHDSFTDFVVNEHIDHSTVSISAGGILSGGGDITASRTISLAQADIDHNSITNTHNLTTDIDHDQLTNYVAGEHFLQTDITNVSTALSTGLLKVTTGTGALSVITDNSGNWDAAYTHSQQTSGNPHNVTPADLSLVIGADVQAWSATLDDLSGTSAAAAQLDSLTDNSIVNSLHRHSELVASDGSVDPALSVASNGYVGIGTASPDRLLKLERDGHVGFVMECTGTSQHAEVILESKSPTGTSHWWTFGVPYGRNSFVISKTGAELGKEFVFSADGNLGIGVSSPSRRLSVHKPGHCGFELICEANSSHAEVILESKSAAGASHWWTFGVPYGGHRFIISSSGVELGNHLAVLSGGNVGIGLTDPEAKLAVAGTLKLQERSSAVSDTAGWGQLWVKNTSPCQLWFTDDTGVDHQIAFV